MRGLPSGNSYGRQLGTEFLVVFAAFFRKPEILRILAFLLLYRFAEAQLHRHLQLLFVGRGTLGVMQQMIARRFDRAGAWNR